MCIRDRGIGSNGRQYSAPSRSTARAGAQAHDHLGGIHSGSPGGAGGDRLFHGGGPHAARTGDLLRAVFHPSREPQGGHRRDHRSPGSAADAANGRNVTMEGCGTLRDCRYLLHDRDTKYTISFRAIIESGGVKPLALPARSRGSLSSARMKCRPPWNRWPGLAVMPSMATRQKTLTLNVFGLNCSLKSSKSRERSSTDALMQQLFGELAKQGATGKIVRAADYNIKPGVKSDEGKGDDWPDLRRQLLAADILVIGAPIWLGQPSSIAKRVMERMDAFLDEKDERGRMPSYGKVVIAAIVGNEDGAHHTAAEILSGLIEVGFTVPSGGSTYWVGEAMGSKEYKEFKRPPKIVAKWTQMLASNTAHLARLLKAQEYPGIKGGR